MRISEICMTITDIEEIMKEVSKEFSKDLKDYIERFDNLSQLKADFNEEIDLTDLFLKHLSKKIVDRYSEE